MPAEGMAAHRDAVGSREGRDGICLREIEAVGGRMDGRPFQRVLRHDQRSLLGDERGVAWIAVQAPGIEREPKPHVASGGDATEPGTKPLLPGVAKTGFA